MEPALLLNSVKVPVIITDRNCTVLSWNSSASEFFSQVIGKGDIVTSLFDLTGHQISECKALEKTGDTRKFSDVEILSGSLHKTADILVSPLDTGSEYSLVFTIVDKPCNDIRSAGYGMLLANADISPSSIVITDRSGLVAYVNRAFEEMTGYSYEEIKGRNINILRPEFLSRENTGLWATISRGEKWKGEFLNARKDGELYWAIASITPVAGADGKISHYISIQEDISYLKKAEDELKQSEEKLRILFESLPEGILVTDLDGNIIQVNRAYLRIFGYADRVMISGRNIHEIFESAGDSIVVELFSQAVSKGYSGITAYELRRDEKVYIDLQAVMITDEEEIPQGFLILADDVTSAKRAEKALRESEARNRALVEAIPDIMFRVDNEGVYLDKMLGTKINEVFPPEVAAEAVRHISDAIKTREIQIYEYPVTISMEERYYEARFIAIDDEEVLIIIRNTTEKRRALDEIENSRREAELASRAKSEFLANMSHEIRTPLNSITGFIELLMRSGVDSSQREYLEIIKKSASNLLEIINDILDFSKIESRKLEINLIEFNPYTEFESVIRLFNVKAQEKGITLLSFIDPLLPCGIISDSLRLKQIMSNFLSNAIKFTPENGTVIAEIKLFRLKGDMCMINFSVSDTGIGIPERKQKQIFEAFAQADSSVTRRYGGTGLGLSISSNLVRLLGSDIVLESTTGIGSRFYFTLEASVSRSDTMRDSYSSFHGLRACILTRPADDLDLINLEYYLQNFGFEISVITDPEKLKESDSDLLFVIHSEGIEPADTGNGDLFTAIPSVLILKDGDRDPSSAPDGVFRSYLCQPLFPENVAGSAINALGMDDVIAGDRAEPQAAGELKFRGRVLVGEDNKTSQKLMMLLLRDYGVDVHIAGNGLDVFGLYKKGEYDLIFMDINMPVADGIETARMILDYESQNGLPHTPVIALTAKVIRDDLDAMSESGMDGYLSKPIEMERLELVLSRYLPVEAAVRGQGSVVVPDYGTGSGTGVYDIKKVAAELRIPVNTLESIGRDFFEESVDVIAEMRKASAERDLEMLRILSHKMKGAAANLRFCAAADLLSAVEENSGAGNKEFDYEKIIDDIELELSGLKTSF